ncbi:MAG TPA: STAS domain-containing protein [Chitinispirillaceae bacterium]|nr:STAS domain-containing protein [Chitinispirillaceae bacterium]
MDIFQHYSNGIVRITLIGQLWQKNELNALSEAVDSSNCQQCKCIILDLQRVSFINSQGLGLLVRIYRDMVDAGGKLILLCNTSSVLEVIEISGFKDFMLIAENEMELQQLLNNEEQKTVV